MRGQTRTRSERLPTDEVNRDYERSDCTRLIKERLRFVPRVVNASTKKCYYPPRRWNEISRGEAMKKSSLSRTYKYFRYNLLRRLPGEWGRYYQRNFLRLQTLAEFDEALRRSEGMTCIDLGANVGKYTRKMASVAKRVIAFEPDPWACCGASGQPCGSRQRQNRECGGGRV